MNQTEKARRFAELHVKGAPLLLFNAWEGQFCPLFGRAATPYVAREQRCRFGVTGPATSHVAFTRLRNATLPGWAPSARYARSHRPNAEPDRASSRLDSGLERQPVCKAGLDISEGRNPIGLMTAAQGATLRMEDTVGYDHSYRP